MGYMRPVKPTYISSWYTHKYLRKPPSQEPGTDYFCPLNTPVHAAGNGVVREVWTSLQPAWGICYAVDLDDGRSYRDMHLNRLHVKVGDRVRYDEIVADSGATGYGSPNWSLIPGMPTPHVHRTLFPVPWARAKLNIGNTLDPELYSTAYPGGSTAGDGGDPFPLEAGDDMYIIRAPGPNRPNLLVAGDGGLLPLNAEESANFGSIVSKDTLLNDRQYDLIVSAMGRIAHGGTNVPLVDAVWAKTVARGDANIPALQELADTKSIGGATKADTETILAKIGSVSVDIDYDKIVAGIVAALPDDVVIDEAVIAKATADEIDRRNHILRGEAPKA